MDPDGRFDIRPQHVLLIVATMVLGLLIDVRADIVGQTLLSVAVWAVLLYILGGVARELRFGLMACLAIATLGELFLSLAWGLYSYRLGNVPQFVPPGHVLLLMLGLALARRMPDAVAWAIIGVAALYSLAAAVAGADTLGVPLFFVLVAASVFMPRQRRLYASTFVLALALELYGTWTRQVPGVGLVTTNPPGVAGAFYCALDALAAAAAYFLAARMKAPGDREALDIPGIDRT